MMALSVAWVGVCCLAAVSAGQGEATTRVHGASAPIVADSLPAADIAFDATLNGEPCLDSACLPRNFGALPGTATRVVPVSLHAGYTPNYLLRPWYLTPYRHYSYYRPWYTYGYYGPAFYRPYHYSPSWGYRPLPWYAPPYLSPAAYGPDYSDCYYW